MQLHEGTLIKRTLIAYMEQSSSGSQRIILHVSDWLGKEHLHHLNRIVLYATVHVDDSSNAIATDALILRLGTYGMTLMKRVSKPGDDSAVQMSEEIELPLATVESPSTRNNIVLKAQAIGWLATETLTYLIEVAAYLMDQGPDELLIRTF